MTRHFYNVNQMQDKYGTQRVVSFLRQLTEQGGFWRTSDKSWVKLNRVQFVGACNPPTDAGEMTCQVRLHHVRKPYPAPHMCAGRMWASLARHACVLLVISLVLHAMV